MKDARLTDFRAKIKLLHDPEVPAETKNRAVDEFLAERRMGEALDFLEKTRDRERLLKVVASAEASGDTFLAGRAERLLGEPLPPERWRTIAERAEANGRFYDAWRALGRAGDEEAAEKLRAERLPGFEPFKPQGK